MSGWGSRDVLSLYYRDGWGIGSGNGEGQEQDDRILAYGLGLRWRSAPAFKHGWGEHFDTRTDTDNLGWSHAHHCVGDWRVWKRRTLPDFGGHREGIGTDRQINVTDVERLYLTADEERRRDAIETLGDL